MAGRKIVDAADAQGCMTAAASSGLTLQEWARANGVDGRSLNAWRLNVRRCVRPAEVTALPSLRLVELVPDPPPVSARYVLRVGRVELEFDDRFKEDSLRRVLAVVAAC